MLINIIVTKYLGPTDTKGSRVSGKPVSRRGRGKSIAWDCALGMDDNHRAAACVAFSDGAGRPDVLAADSAIVGQSSGPDGEIYWVFSLKY